MHSLACRDLHLTDSVTIKDRYMCVLEKYVTQAKSFSYQCKEIRDALNAYVAQSFLSALKERYFLLL